MYFSAYADKKAVVNFLDMHVEENTKNCFPGITNFENGASSKIEDILAEDGGLLHVLTLAIHLNFFFDGQVGGTILDNSCFLNFFVGPLLHALMMFLLKMVNYSMSFLSLST